MWNQEYPVSDQACSGFRAHSRFLVPLLRGVEPDAGREKALQVGTTVPDSPHNATKYMSCLCSSKRRNPRANVMFPRVSNTQGSSAEHISSGEQSIIPGRPSNMSP